jgi:hemoglobin/transferrin/lactoferrin receptor protein
MPESTMMSILRPSTSRRAPLLSAGLLSAALAGVWAPAASAQTLAQGEVAAPAARVVAPADAKRDTTVYNLSPVVVTATRTAKPVFITPAPVNLVGTQEINAAQANTVTDLFRQMPGFDVAGVGVQQARPIIRGQRGQRILLLQDAMRLNNSRRQQEFGEIPGLVDLSTVERIEVVRGPSSVLYGTDAIGGVVNLITRTPTTDGVHGTVGYRFGSASDLHRGMANVLGRFGALDIQVNAALREAGEYRAPAGSFGAITLDSAATVIGTGARDRTAAARVGFRFLPNHNVFARADLYEARDAGFGLVEPAAYDRTQARIDIRYPDQNFRKLTFGYGGTDLRTFLADRADLVGYVQQNVRDVAFNLDQALGPARSPGGTPPAISVRQFNYSDVATTGLRLEAKKLAHPRLLLTYGVDAFRDRSENSDSSVTRITGFGPAPQVTVDRKPQVPNATFRSTGAFLQGEVALGRASVVLGTRVQDVHAETRETEGLPETFQSKSNRTVVGSASAIYAITDGLSVLGSVGRGFRSPNLIEWFYEGLSTDGRYFQARNVDLEPETSLNFDAGLRFRNERLSFEGFAFRNKIQDGIRTVPTEARVNNRVVYRNVNIDELIFRGVELNADLALPLGLALGGGYARQEAKDARDPNIPVGDLYSSKMIGTLRYGSLADRFWAEYGVRHQGEQRDADLQDNPIGDALPAFTVQHLRGGVTVFQRGSHAQRLSVTLGNLTNRLYAETSNSSFFRPEPGRHLLLSWEASF